MAKNLRIVTVWLDDKTVGYLDEMIRRGIFTNRSEAVRWIIKMFFDSISARSDNFSEQDCYAVDGGSKRLRRSFVMTEWMMNLTKERAKALGLVSFSEYIRYLVVSDIFKDSFRNAWRDRS